MVWTATLLTGRKLGQVEIKTRWTAKIVRRTKGDLGAIKI
jgi:hypothetical protein